MAEFRRLRHDETDQAATLHRRASKLIPGYPMLHTPEEDSAYYRERVFEEGPIWGAFDGGTLLGHLALYADWIEHLYVEPGRHGEGIGRALLTIAKAARPDLQLWTFQANARARRFYEAAGFVAQEFTDGAHNEEKQPDVRYRWRRLGARGRPRGRRG
ncbi:GNAT family N-acetyltransferase [Sphingomonas sp.]|uniref:GNAT family N-acetyltransferase n=1 Tax=Sphingomonas sp. TaxID=28214 RepID=UPI003CC64987